MKGFVLIILLSVTLPSFSQRIVLSEQVYFYAPVLDTLKCEAYGECDCCSGHILFLDKNKFIIIDDCEGSALYCKGNYEIEKGNVTLEYDSIIIAKNYNWDKIEDTTKSAQPDYFIEQSTAAPMKAKLTRSDCRKKVCFIMGEKEKYFVTPDTQLRSKDMINQLKKDGIWSKLNF